ncbi:stathmin domain-containing protein 1 [Halichoeres trimaculatus]|uniref:stathmin domain-containing protein 1 n=1 Tax=Halichoeres trimaculatus TaxID=147232 RepID=UPI003D9DD939
MGCGSSSNTAVKPMTPEEMQRDENETGSRRGDSAVSKVTTDSGVVMDNRDITDLPGAVPRKLPPLKFVRESDTSKITQDGTLQERQNSSKILEELLHQGIIPAGQSREKSHGAGEAYSIMLGDSEGVMRRPPARLEALKVKRAQTLPSIEDIEEKMRLADERRKLKENKLKMRLRSKSARVRGPAPTSSSIQDEDLTPVETLLSPLSPDTLSPSPHSLIPREAAEGGECVREAAGDGRESKEDKSSTKRREGKEERGGENGCREVEEEEEESTQVEKLKKDELTASGSLESGSSFQCREVVLI